MKKLLYILILLSFCGLHAQTAAKWENVYGGPGVEEGFSVKCYFNKGYVAVGSSGSLGVSDGYLVRVDTVGLTLWEKFYGGTNVDVIRSIHVLPDSGFIMAGYSNSSGYGGYDGWLVRADKNGDTLWTKYIGTSNWDFFYDVYPTYDSGFVIAGGTYGLGMGDEDMYFVKTDKNGDTLWTKTYGGTRTDEARGILQTGDSMFYASGYTNSMGDSLGDIWLLRLNGIGDTLFTKFNGTPNSKDQGYGISQIAPFGWIFVSGMATMAGDEQARMWLVLQGNGSTIQSNTFGNPGSEAYYTTAAYPFGSYGLGGYSQNQGAGGGDIFSNVNGTLTTFGYMNLDIAYGMDTAYYGGFIFCGQSSSFVAGLPQLYLVKTDSQGYSVNTVGINELIHPKQNECVVYPVPADENVTVSIPSEKNEGALIIITDVEGRVVKEISSIGSFSGSSMLNSVQVSDLNNGVYLVTVFSPNGGSFASRIIIEHSAE